MTTNQFVKCMVLIVLSHVVISCFAEELKGDPTFINDEMPSSVSNVLTQSEPLPINARILSLLKLAQTEPTAAQALLPKLEEINAHFNSAEKYLMLMVRAHLAKDKGQENKIINWSKQALVLEEKIVYQQLILPEFIQAHVLLADNYALTQQFKLAYDQKKLYRDKYRDYRKALKEKRLLKLNSKYETDLKIKENELLVSQQNLQRIKLEEAEKKSKSQYRNLFFLCATAIVFIILLIRQLKIRSILQTLSNTDSLTGLYNRRNLFVKGNALLMLAFKKKSALSVILLDIDFFKKINDSYGHNAGDDVIKAIANIGTEIVRSKDVFARLGGEEFAIILPETDHDQAKAIAERFRERVQQLEFSTNDAQYSTTISAGVASLSQVNGDFDILLSAADDAMYLAKGSGRNQVCSYQPS